MPEHTVLVIDDSPTIRKVVQLVLNKAGFHVVTADDGEAGVEAAHNNKPDVILLDFVMPKMNGYQVCRELADHSDVKDIPIVLMSAKGDQVGDRFVKVMGIVDYITKPFSPEAIVAVVQHTVTKYSQRSMGEYTKPILAGPGTIEEFDTASEETTTNPGQDASAVVMESLRSAISDRVVTQLAGNSDDSEIDNDKIAEAVENALQDEAVATLLRRGGMTLASADVSLSGDVKIVPIAEILQLLDAQSQSGVLLVDCGESTVEVYFRRGHVDFAVARNVPEEFLLGRFLVDGGFMSREDLDGFLESRSDDAPIMGQQLIKLGYVSDEELKTVLRTQTNELIYELLRWSTGSFQFTRSSKLPPRAAQASLGLDVEGILMEGFRRVDEWHLIEREVNNFDTVYLRNEDAVAQMGKGLLTRDELKILELVNGKNTVKDLIRSTKLGSFDVSKMLYRLLSIKLIRRRVLPVAV